MNTFYTFIKQYLHVHIHIFFMIRFCASLLVVFYDFNEWRWQTWRSSACASGCAWDLAKLH